MTFKRIRLALPALAILIACEGGTGVGPPPDTGPRVLSVVPAANSSTAPRAGDLMLRLDRPLDPDRLAQLDIRVFGRWSGVVGAGFRLEEGNRAIRVALAQPLAAGEMVTATLVAGSYRDHEGATGPGYTWSFYAASAAASLDLVPAGTVPVRRPGEPQIQTYGAYAGDLDGDGWSDLILPNEKSSDIRIFLNDGAGGYGDFDVVPVPDGIDPSTNEGADLDGDGDIDFVVGSARGSLVAVFLGDGAGGMTHGQNLEVGQAVRGVCLLDFENDGDPDLVATAFAADHVALFENLGGSFLPAGTLDVGDGEWSCAPGDVNDDGLMDVFIGTRGSNEVVALGSRGDGTFETLGRVSAGGDPWMLASGDLDGDGRVDVASVNAVDASLSVVVGTGQGELALLAQHDLDGFPLAVDVGDLDGDGDLEVLASDFSTGRFVLFENHGANLSRTAELAARTAASCAILHDRDNDGDLDVTGIDEVDDLLLLFENPR